MPVTSTTSVNTRAWVSPFWPVVASSTSSVSSTGPCFSTTRLTLPSSSISPTLVCSRPAVSISTVSTLRLGALLARRRTRRTPGRRPRARARSRRRPASPTSASWSAAAARNVSAAPSSTVRPSATSTRASLPQVVVLPVPFTPTTITTAGRSAGRRRVQGAVQLGLQRGDQLLGQQRAQLALRAGAEHLGAGPQPFDDLGGRRRHPTSAVSRASSISSHASSSSFSRDSTDSRPRPSAFCERASRARSRCSRPAVGSGVSSAGGAARSSTVARRLPTVADGAAVVGAALRRPASRPGAAARRRRRRSALPPRRRGTTRAMTSDRRDDDDGQGYPEVDSRPHPVSRTTDAAGQRVAYSPPVCHCSHDTFQSP